MAQQFQPSPDTVAIAERLLTAKFGGAVRLGQGDDLGGMDRSHSLRFPILAGPDGAPESVIVRQANPSDAKLFDPNAGDIIAWTLFNDWAALEFLSQVAGDTPLGPRFYGGDRAAGIVVSEDMGTGTRLDQLLLANDPTHAEQTLVDYAATVGRMHALTIGKRSMYEQLRQPLGSAHLQGGYYSYDWIGPTVQTSLDTLGLDLQSSVKEDVAKITATLRDPGPFLAFTHGDPCPDNCMRVGVELRLLDFEGGGFGFALKDGVYGRMRFPTCWCVNQLPNSIALDMETAYRTELIKGCPEAADDTTFYRAVVTACAFWLIAWFNDFPVAPQLEKDRTIKISTVRQRSIARAELVAQASVELGYLEAFGAIAGQIAVELRKRLPTDAQTLSVYPAFS